MSATEEALVVAVRAGDAAARAVYADLLEEQGYMIRAALLRDPRSLGAIIADLATWVSTISEIDYYAVAPGKSFLTLSPQQDILPGQEVSITSRSNKPFRPTQLVVPDETAAYFEISDFKIGNRSQFEHLGPIPGALLTASAVAAHNGLFRFGIAQPAMDITVVVRNTDALPQQFTCLVLGNEAAATDWYIGTAVV